MEGLTETVSGRLTADAEDVRFAPSGLNEAVHSADTTWTMTYRHMRTVRLRGACHHDHQWHSGDEVASVRCHGARRIGQQIVQRDGLPFEG